MAAKPTNVNGRSTIGKVNRSPELEGYCGHCGKWRHKQKDCRERTLLLRWMRRRPLNFSSSTNRVTPPPPGLRSTGTAQSTAGTICTLMEKHAIWKALRSRRDRSMTRGCDSLLASRLHTRCADQWSTSRAQEPQLVSC